MDYFVLYQSLQSRLSYLERYLEHGGQQSYDLCADSGYNEAIKEEIEFLRKIGVELEGE